MIWPAIPALPGTHPRLGGGPPLLGPDPAGSDTQKGSVGSTLHPPTLRAPGTHARSGGWDNLRSDRAKCDTHTADVGSDPSGTSPPDDSAKPRGRPVAGAINFLHPKEGPTPSALSGGGAPVRKVG